MGVTRTSLCVPYAYPPKASTERTLGVQCLTVQLDRIVAGRPGCGPSRQSGPE
jgi:hypothetical protein